MRKNTGHRNQKTIKGPTWKRANLVNPTRGRELIMRAARDEINREMRRLVKQEDAGEPKVESVLVREILVKLIKTHNIPTATHTTLTGDDIVELNEYYARELRKIAP